MAANLPEPASTAFRGRQGETAACRILENLGVKVLQRNFRTARGEVDIIAMDRETLCFIEVKTWKRDLWPDLNRSVDARKRQRIRQTAVAWLAQNLGQRPADILRFDLFLLDPETGSHDWLTGALDY